MNIRHATMKDLEKIAALEAIAFPEKEAASKESIEKRLQFFPDCFWLLEDNQELIGFINGMVTKEADLTDEMYDTPEMHDEKGEWQMIFSVVTAPKHQGNGYASKIMNQVIADVKAKKRAGLVLTCKEKLLPFYGSFGFKNEGVSASTHGDVMWYQMRLDFSKLSG